MIDIPLADIITKIKAQKGLSEQEIRAKIKEKLTQLAGLISEQGAAHIVANELGVELITHAAEAKVKDLYPGMRNITVNGKVTRKFDLKTFAKDGRQGQVASFFIGDETGRIKVTLWNNQADNYDALKENDTVRIKNGFVKENRGYAEIHLNTDSKLELNPAGVTVSTPAERQERQGPPRERKTIKELTGTEENVELLTTVVQVYDPRFFDVCPKCNKRVLTMAGVHHAGEPVPAPESKCPEHGTVTPMTNYVVSAFLDDGTGNIRATLWKQQAQRFCSKSDSEMLLYQQNPAAFEAVKTELLGQIIKVVGRCKKNDTFDRIELTVNLVFNDVDPEQELARMAEESKHSVEKLDAPAALKEEIKKVLEEPKKPVREEVQAEYFESDHDDFSEEAISLDDLEDLDEKL